MLCEAVQQLPRRFGAVEGDAQPLRELLQHLNVRRLRRVGPHIVVGVVLDHRHRILSRPSGAGQLFGRRHHCADLIRSRDLLAYSAGRRATLDIGGRGHNEPPTPHLAIRR
jgi:hypothetical protein